MCSGIRDQASISKFQMHITQDFCPKCKIVNMHRNGKCNSCLLKEKSKKVRQTSFSKTTPDAFKFDNLLKRIIKLENLVKSLINDNSLRHGFDEDGE